MANSISLIKPCAPEKGRCIEVDRADGVYLIGKRHTPTHNSMIASWHFPAWHLGRNPDHEVIATSYAASLALGFSRKARALVQSADFKLLFPKCQLNKDIVNAENWQTKSGGGYRAAGVGGPLTGTGCHCVSTCQTIETVEGPIRFDSLLKRGQDAPDVLCWVDGKLTSRKINGFVTRTADHCYTIKTSTGSFKATGEHPVCVGFEEGRPLYRRVDDLRVGEELFSVRPADTAISDFSGAVPDVFDAVQQTPGEVSGGARGLRGAVAYVQQHMLSAVSYARAQSKVGVRYLRERLFGGQILSSGQKSEGAGAALLLRCLLRQAPIRAFCGGGQPEVQIAGCGVRGMWGNVSATSLSSGAAREPLLQSGMLCRESTWEAYPDGARYPWGTILSPRVQAGPQASDAGQLCRVWRRGEGRTPSGRRQDEQCAEQRGSGMQALPHNAPYNDAYSRIESITRVEGDIEVGDIEVEGAHNFLLPSGTLLLNCLLIDDPVKNWEEAESETVRESVWEWYTSTAYTRLAPGGGVLIIQTRWNEMDLSGRIIEAMGKDPLFDQFRIVDYPALALKDEKHRKEGEALHPERFDEAALRRYEKNVGPRVWNALYQQRPAPDEGAYFKKDYFRYYEVTQLPTDLDYYAAWDLAITAKEDNDPTAGFVVGVDKDSNWWIVDRIHGRWTTYDIVENIINTILRWRPSVTWIEKDKVALAIGPILERTMQERRVRGYVEQVPTGRKDKVQRARSLQGLMQQKKVYIPSEAPWLSDFESEMLKFPHGKHDDQVDALAHMAIQMEMMWGTRPPRAKSSQPISWKDKLGSIVSRRNGPKSYMSA